MESNHMAITAILAIQEALSPEVLAECLLSMDAPTRDWYLQVLIAHHSQLDEDSSVLDS